MVRFDQIHPNIHSNRVIFVHFRAETSLKICSDKVVMLEIILGQRGGVVVLTLLIVFSLYLVSLIVYRLFLSPIAKFPGPKLAAVTYLYENYYDVVKRGKYTFKIRDLHAKYGQSRAILRPSLYQLKAL